MCTQDTILRYHKDRDLLNKYPNAFRSNPVYSNPNGYNGIVPNYGSEEYANYCKENNIHFHSYVHNENKDRFALSMTRRKLDFMTCCIALLADDGKSAALSYDNIETHFIVSDQVITTTANNHVKKVRQFGSSNVLFAGDSGVCMFILEQADKIMKSDSNIGIAKSIQDAIINELNEQREAVVLRQWGVNWQVFRENQLHKDFVEFLSNKMSEIKLDCEFIVVENNNDTLDMKTILNNSNILDRKGNGIAIMGAGTPLANSYISNTGYNKSMKLNEVVNIVSEAMKEAERSPYVGKMVEIITMP